MSKFYNDTMLGLMQAIAIDKGNSSEFRKLLNERLKDPEFKKEWDAAQPEIEKIRREIRGNQ